VCTAPFNQLWPFVMGDGAGGVFIAWSDQRDSAGTGFDIYMQRLDASGIPMWMSNGVAVCTAPGHQYAPQLIADVGGGVIMTWSDHRTGLAQVYAQRVDGSGVRSWAPGGVPLSSTPYYHYLNESHYPCIIPDGEGGAIVTWGQVITGTNEDIYAQRIDSTGVLLWGPTGVPVCTAVTFQLYPMIIADGAGGAIIAWEDFRDYPTGHIYAQRLGPDGSRRWTANGVLASRLGGDQRAPVLVTDGAQGAIIANEDFPNAYIFAQRIDAGGSLRWGAEGVRVSALAPTHLPFVASDQVGGAIIGFKLSAQSPSGTSLSDAYAQRVDADGDTLWGSNGAALSTADRGQNIWGFAPDLAGGAIGVWTDSRRQAPDANDLYAQHLDATGNPQWQVNGIPLVEGPGIQFRPIAASDGSGGAVVAWEDTRNGIWWATHKINFDIYATRVGGAQPVVGVPDPEPPAVRFVSAWPNPTGAGTTLTFALPAAMAVTLEVFDVTGGRVRTLLAGEGRAAGTHTLAWDGRDGGGHRVAAGLYLVRLAAAGRTVTRRIVVLP
jgi:hypothetical protein